MEVESFLGYLRYQYCIELEKHRTYVVYQSSVTGLTTSIGIRHATVHPNLVCLACNALGIDAPEEYLEIQKRFNRIP